MARLHGTQPNVCRGISMSRSTWKAKGRRRRSGRHCVRAAGRDHLQRPAACVANRAGDRCTARHDGADRSWVARALLRRLRRHAVRRDREPLPASACGLAGARLGGALSRWPPCGGNTARVRPARSALSPGWSQPEPVASWRWSRTGACWSACTAQYRGSGFERARDSDLLNASINRFDWDGCAFRLLQWGDIAHRENFDLAALDEVDKM